jgi:CubicO group peptidase (beta-lactamase class C family)
MSGYDRRASVMRTLPRWVVFVAAATVAFAGLIGHAQPRAKGAPDKEGISTDRLAALDRRYQEGVDKGEIPGAVVMIARNGRVIYERAFGFASAANRTPMTTRTLFRLASLTKPVTSVAVMQLVDQGRVTLQEPIATYLPELKDLKVGVEIADPAGERRLTLVAPQRPPNVQDLLRHTSGLVYGQFGDGPVHRAYVKASIGAMDVTSAEMVTRLARLPLAHHPGTTFEYSVSTDVLGRLVEVVSGLSLDQYVDQHIARPLGLQSFAFHARPEYTLALPPEDATAEAGRLAADARSRPPRFLSGGGGMYATGGDYMRFAQMLLNGGELDGVRILSPKSVALMTSDHLPPCVVHPPNMRSLLSIIAPTPEMGQGFGLGFAVRVAPGRNPLPGSVGEFYWAGITGVYFWVDPQERLIVASMTAQGKADIRIRYRQLARQLVYQSLVTSNPPLVVPGTQPAACSPPPGAPVVLPAPSRSAN